MKTINLKDVRPGESKIRAMIYGEAGSGKTHLLREMPKPLLLMDFDGKYEPLMGVDGIEVVSYYSAVPQDADKNMIRFWREWREAKKDSKWATIAIDSLSALDRMLERFVVINSGKGKDPDERATLQEYGDMKNWYKTFFSSICSVTDKHIFVLAHEQFKEDKDSGIIAIRPMVTGKIGNDIPSMFKDTWFLEVKIKDGKPVRVLHYQKYKKYICATVSMEGKGTIENPTFDKIMAVRKK